MVTILVLASGMLAILMLFLGILTSYIGGRRASGTGNSKTPTERLVWVFFQLVGMAATAAIPTWILYSKHYHLIPVTVTCVVVASIWGLFSAWLGSHAYSRGFNYLTGKKKRCGRSMR